MKISVLIDSVMPLRQLSEVDMPMKVAIKIKKLMLRLQVVLDVFGEKEKKLMEEYGEPNEDGPGFAFPDKKKLKTYSEKRKELLEEEVDDFVIPIIKLEDIGKKSEFIKPSILFKLDWLILVEDDEEDETDATEASLKEVS